MLLEAVPNVSLGPGDPLLEEVTEELEEASSPAWRLLDVHSDPDHCRSVLTMAGAPAPLLRGLTAMVDVLAERGSLVGHEGVHPRVGLLDVVPLVALGAARTVDAERIARQVVRRLADRGIPVYGYGGLAKRPEHEALVGIRRKVKWQGSASPLPVPPDAGPAAFHERLGASCVGVRAPLVAYNVLLDTRDLEIGDRIARSVRESAGGLAGVQALAFTLPSRGARVQVSANVTDLEATGPADVYERVRRLAADVGVDVLGGELVGLAPRGALPEDPAAMGLDEPPVPLEERLATEGLAPRHVQL